jgi:repressor LexA
MNDRTLQVLRFIEDRLRKHGGPPTIREIGDECGISSTNGVRYHIGVLEREGHVRRTGRISRGIELTRPIQNYDDASSGIPVLGRVAAGAPILAEENWSGTIEPGRLFGDVHGLFALQVRGDSMIDAGVLDGDYVVVRAQDQARTGEMIVALVADEATVKFYRPKADHVELEPANEEYRPIVLEPGTEFRILGVVKGVIRTVGR